METAYLAVLVLAFLMIAGVALLVMGRLFRR